MDLYPAIDLRGGRCVRLYQGDFDRETVYGDDPVAQAAAFADAGAPWIHVVDLDAARTGEPVNRPVIAAIAGVGRARRCRPAAASATTRRPTRCSTPAWPGSWSAPPRSSSPSSSAGSPRAGPAGSRVGLDVRGARWRCAGWVEGSGRQLLDVAARVRPTPGSPRSSSPRSTVDGAGTGPDLDSLRRRCSAAGRARRRSRRAASARSTTSATLAALEVGGRRLAGVIVGQALYEGAFTVDDAAGCHDEHGLTVRTARVIPCLDVDAGRVVKGVNFVDLRDAGDPGRAGRPLRRRGRRRARLPRHHRVVRRPRHDRRRRRPAPPSRCSSRSRSAAASAPSTTPAGCCGPAPTRCRSTPPRSTGPS